MKELAPLRVQLPPSSCCHPEGIFHPMGLGGQTPCCFAWPTQCSQSHFLPGCLPTPPVPAEGTPCTCPLEGVEAPLKWVGTPQCVQLAKVISALLLDFLSLQPNLCSLHLRCWISPSLTCCAPRAKLYGLSAFPATCFPVADLSISLGVQPAYSAVAFFLGWAPVEPPEFSSLSLAC